MFDSGDEIGQDGNCGNNCAAGIAADRNGVVWPELYLYDDGFYSGGTWYSYEDEGMPNEFDICKAQCFPDAVVDQNTGTMLCREVLRAQAAEIDNQPLLTI